MNSLWNYENRISIDQHHNINLTYPLEHFDTSYKLPNYTMNMYNWQPTHYNLTESNNIMTLNHISIKA